MKVVICGSSKFRKEKVGLISQLKRIGHEGIIDPWSVELASERNPDLLNQIESEHSAAKKQYGFIKWYYEAIKSADAIIVYNSPKNSIDGYIGANTFLEIGYAHALDKKAFLYFSFPEQEYIKDEIMAMEPICLNGVIGNINKEVT